MDSKETKTILIDCDGVLTDGIVYYTHEGQRTKGFHSRDIRAVRELVSMGYDVFVLTQSAWPGLEVWAKRTGATVAVARDKGQWISANISGPYIAIGDDTADMSMLAGAVIAVCPADADRAVLNMPNITRLNCNGGHGVVAEMVYFIKTAVHDHLYYHTSL